MAREYRIVSYRSAAAGPRAGVVVSEQLQHARTPVDARVHDARALLGLSDAAPALSVLDLLDDWAVANARIAGAVAQVEPDAGVPLPSVELLAPILYPPAIYSVWGNYVDHNAEMARLSGREAPVVDPSAEPFWVQKTSAQSVIGHGASIRMPSFTQQLDYEAELGVVIGARVRNASAAEAAAAVAGYVILNDLSARDQMRRKDARTAHLMDWFGMKSFEDSCPMGPWLTPATFVADPADLSIRLWVNGLLKQDGNTSAMVYSIGAQVAALSRRLTLLPGDVIASGCPAGVGVARGEFLAVGDQIRIEIAGCGALVNRIVAGT